MLLRGSGWTAVQVIVENQPPPVTVLSLPTCPGIRNAKERVIRGRTSRSIVHCGEREREKSRQTDVRPDTHTRAHTPCWPL